MKALTPAQLIAWRAPFQPYIIGDKILVQQGTMVVYGEQESWKSMTIGIDLAHKIALGKNWFGHATVASPVYVFQTEIPQAELQGRVSKYALGNKAMADNIYFRSELYMKLDKGWGYTDLEAELSEVLPKVLVVDPIISTMSGKIVDNYDVSQFLDRINMLREKFKVAVILVHHSRQSEHHEGETYRYGAEEILGPGFARWADTIAYIEKVKDDEATDLVDLQLTFEKARHAEKKLRSIQIRVDRDDLTFKAFSEVDDG